MWANRINNKVTFEQAQQIVEWRKRYRNLKELERQIFKREKRAVEPKDLPYVDCCYLIASAKGKRAIENLNSYLTTEDAQKITHLWHHLNADEWKALVKKEIPKLYDVYESWLNYMALYTFIEYRAGEDFGD